jgi:hypothetical protein
MTDMDLASAQIQALAAIARLAEEQGLGELVLVEDCIVETPDAWYFSYDSADFILGGDVSSALAGNIPVRVARDQTGVRFEEPDSV